MAADDASAHRGNKRPFLETTITQETPCSSARGHDAAQVKKALFEVEFQPILSSQQQQPPQAPEPSKFKLRQIKWDYTQQRRTNDEIHSSCPLNPVVTVFLDTPHMQRLRGLKQLGTAEHVYFNCNHTRFEHSVGVSHLAATMCRRIARQQPSLRCTPKDVLCVQLAGLLHDIGHGPFSHCYEHFVKVDLPNHLQLHPECNDAYHKGNFPALCTDWDHEDASLMMIDAILLHLGLEMDISNLDAPLKQVGHGIDALSLRATAAPSVDSHCSNIPKDPSAIDPMILTTRDLLFVKECICGSPIGSYTRELGPGFHGRPLDHQDWLYDIVANRHSGLDVDKIDYFARDQRRALKESGEINKVMLESAIVAWAPCTDPTQCHRCAADSSSHDTDPNQRQSHLMICFPKKLLAESVEFFRTRFSLHSKIYKHKTIESVALMISDIFCLADPYFLIPTARGASYGQSKSTSDSGGGTLKEDFDAVPISRAMHYPGSYLRLKDSVIDQIEATRDPQLEPARALIERLRNRDLYKCAASKVLHCHVSAVHRCIWDKPEKEIMEEILRVRGQHTCHDGQELTLSPEDIVVLKCDIHHGQKTTDPLTKMRFLEKNQLNKVSVDNYHDLPVATVVDPAEYESRLPRTLRECSLRIYARSAQKLDLLSHLFNQWWEEVESEMQMTVEGDDGDNEYLQSLPISQEYDSDDETGGFKYHDNRVNEPPRYNGPRHHDSDHAPWCSPQP